MKTEKEKFEIKFKKLLTYLKTDEDFISMEECLNYYNLNFKCVFRETNKQIQKVQKHFLIHTHANKINITIIKVYY